MQQRLYGHLVPLSDTWGLIHSSIKAARHAYIRHPNQSDRARFIVCHFERPTTQVQHLQQSVVSPYLLHQPVHPVEKSTNTSYPKKQKNNKNV